MGRISNTFLDLKKRKRKALISYVVAGDPDIDCTLNAMHLMVSSGVDLIELGIPFSDPMAEGPSIQMGHERALENKTSLKDSLDIVKRFRKKNQDTPIILMGYMNPFESMGSKNFSSEASISGVDGILIVDMPPEESDKFTKEACKFDIDIIRLVAPTTSKSRIRTICKRASGFIYYISLKGTTGANSIDIKEVQNKVTLLQSITNLPVVIGFGIRDQKTTSSIKDLADGIVVGSVLVDIMGGEKLKIEKDLSTKIRDLSQALNEN